MFKLLSPIIALALPLALAAQAVPDPKPPVTLRMVSVAWPDGYPVPELRKLAKDAAGPSVLGEAAKRAGDEGLAKQTTIRADLQSGGFVVRIYAKGDPQKLAPFVEDLADRVASHVAGHWENAADLSKALSEEAARRAEVQLAQEQADVRELQEKLRAATRWTDVTPSALKSAMNRLEQERQKLVLDNVGQRARREALELAIARMAREAEGKLKDDAVGAEFAKIVELRMQELARVRELVAKNLAADAQLEATQAAVAEARAKLFERREAVARAAGGDLLGELNRELAMLAVASAEADARQKFIDDTLTGFSKAANDIDLLETALIDMARAKSAVADAKQSRDRALRSQHFQQRPQIIIRGDTPN